MALNQQKRENLLLEATAYSRRILISLVNVSYRDNAIGELFAGVRPDGRWSLYFDESPVIQFDLHGSLRRVYVADKKLAATRGQLVELHRELPSKESSSADSVESSSVQGGKVHGGRVHLVPQPLDTLRQTQLLDELKDLLARTYQELKASQSIENDRISRQFDPDSSDEPMQLSKKTCRVVGIIPSDDQQVYDELLSFLESRLFQLSIGLSL